MIVADTNVWARAFLGDDVIQTQKARKALADAQSRGGVFVPLIVLTELAWVLRSRWDRDRVLTTVEGLLQTRGVAIETASIAQDALRAARSGKGGFADHLIAEVGFAQGAAEILTFDETFAKVRRLK
jgi:predicted nucleic-acid-binding protein